MGSGKGRSKRLSAMHTLYAPEPKQIDKDPALEYISDFELDFIPQKSVLDKEVITSNQNKILNFFETINVNYYPMHKENLELDDFPFDPQVNEVAYHKMTVAGFGGFFINTSMLKDYVNVTKEEKAIVLNKTKLKNHFYELFNDVKELDPDSFLHELSEHETNDLHEMWQQHLLLHETGHALTFNSLMLTPEDSAYEELKAELFAQKTMRNLYGENLFTQLYSIEYLRLFFSSLKTDGNYSNDEALQRLISANEEANEAVKTITSHLIH